MDYRKILRKMLLESGHLSESKTLYIQDYNYDDSFKNVSDVMAYSRRIAEKHMEEVIGYEQTRQYMNGQTFSYDGDTQPYGEQGTINIYLFNKMPVELGVHLAHLIQRELLKKGVKIETRDPEQSQAMGVPVVRLVVQEIGGAENEPEMVNLSNANAHYIFTHVLNYSQQEYEDGHFDIKDVRIRIEFAKENMDLHDTSGGHPKDRTDKLGQMANYKQADILRRLEDFDEFTQFALQKGFKEIYIA